MYTQAAQTALSGLLKTKRGGHEVGREGKGAVELGVMRDEYDQYIWNAYEILNDDNKYIYRKNSYLQSFLEASTSSQSTTCHI